MAKKIKAKDVMVCRTCYAIVPKKFWQQHLVYDVKIYRQLQADKTIKFQTRTIN